MTIYFAVLIKIVACSCEGPTMNLQDASMKVSTEFIASVENTIYHLPQPCCRDTVTQEVKLIKDRDEAKKALEDGARVFGFDPQFGIREFKRKATTTYEITEQDVKP